MRDFITSAQTFTNQQEFVNLNTIQNDDSQGLAEQGQLQAMKEELCYSLKKKIMKVGKQKVGDKVSLNPQCLKELYRLIMTELNPNERASIAIYELQTFIIELALKPKEDWNNMNFEMFINFIMSYIRLEPNLWIKSSDVHQGIVQKLRDQFGESLGALPSTQPTQSFAPLDINEQKKMKQNQKAIASYKRYIEESRHLRNPHVNLNGNDTKSDSMPQSAANDEKGKQTFSQFVLEEVKCDDSLEVEEKEDSFQEKIKQQKIQKRADHLKKGHTIDIKLIPQLYNFYLAHIVNCQISLTETQKFLLQNFIMFLSFKEKKNKLRRLNDEIGNGKASTGELKHSSRYSMLISSGIEYDDEIDNIKIGKRTRNPKVTGFYSQQIVEAVQMNQNGKDDQNYNSDTSLSSLINDDYDFQAKLRETNTKYNLRQRPMFSMRFEGDDVMEYHNPLGSKMSQSAMKRKNHQKKRDMAALKLSAQQTLENYDTFQKLQDWVNAQIINSESFSNDLKANPDQKLPSSFDKMTLSDKIILSNIMVIIDQYVLSHGWQCIIHQEDITMFDLAQLITKITKHVFQQGQQEAKDIVIGYIYQIQNRILINTKGKTAMKYMAKVIKTSSKNRAILKSENLDNLTLQPFGTPWTQNKINNVIQAYKVFHENQTQSRQHQNHPFDKEVELDSRELDLVEELIDDDLNLSRNESANKLTKTNSKNKQPLKKSQSSVIVEKKEKLKHCEESKNHKSNIIEEKDHLISPADSNNFTQQNESPSQYQQKFVKKWSEQDYKRFLEAVDLFKDSQLGNKKIAKYMGDHIDPIQIRHEKTKYQKNKRKQEREQMVKRINQAQNTMHSVDWVESFVQLEPVNKNSANVNDMIISQMNSRNK
ncbi:UNKNOWN [Stylonychia lemnae]|uniref:Uncharacterized protein n=1 Tax=Stylonychia lemnae TaxID=5949 RepID=A0A078B0R3_STYLE|nr:UNKNOWN [Stylonychia lemnae]|eukprot:CDW88250.1 UNKNOWN [Stylonychia lemnae]